MMRLAKKPFVLPMTLMTLVVLTPARATAPDDQYIRYDQRQEIIADRFTNLNWQRRISLTAMNDAQARAYCAGLVVAGQSAWRVPTVKELLTLVDEDEPLAFDKTENASVPRTIDLFAFPETPARTFRASRNFCVNFADGSAGPCAANDMYLVRCVK